MIPKEILKKVKRIEIATRGLVNDVFSGEYHSVFKGRGMEFSEVREYQLGDDIRSIDWNVTARMGHPYVKVFEEERELTVMLLVDVSSSGNFGTVERMKGEIAIEICALLAFSAIKNNDKVGLIIFTDTVEKFVPPKKGKSHVLRVLRELLYHEPRGSKTNISEALEYFSRVTKRRSVVFLVSDFISENYEKALQIANKRHDIVAITVTDPRELELPDVGFIELEDAETGEIFTVDTSYSGIRGMFREQTSDVVMKRTKLFQSMNVDHIDIKTDQSYIDPLIRFFRMRAKRFR
ncbi:MAG: DUF58 domain-containing protein [candidate division KSB1 bacterium]|jgi:uncharacterized protein (DUF58 family)|nr:DUF58 domain-containing protein [candidate division KSB1 bacterium]